MDMYTWSQQDAQLPAMKKSQCKTTRATIYCTAPHVAIVDRCAPVPAAKLIHKHCSFVVLCAALVGIHRLAVLFGNETTLALACRLWAHD